MHDLGVDFRVVLQAEESDRVEVLIVLGGACHHGLYATMSSDTMISLFVVQGRGELCRVVSWRDVLCMPSVEIRVVQKYQS